MSYSPRKRRHDRSPSPMPRYRSRSRSGSPSRHRDEEIDAYNPGNNLYVTGLSVRVNERDLEDYFSKEGKVAECHLVVDPRSKESRGFGFVTMSNPDEAERCIKYLNKSIFEGRVITVEKAKRRRPRTPTPGKYLGFRNTRTVSSYDRDRQRGGYSDLRRSPRYSPFRNEREYLDQYSPSRRRNRGRSPSPRYSTYGTSYRPHHRSRSRSASPYNYR